MASPCLPSSSPGNRPIKAPKLYLNDTGLLCHLLGIDAARLANDDLMTGALPIGALWAK